MPKVVKTKKVHFLDCFIGRPVIHSHAVGSDENTGSILTESAMHEDGPWRMTGEQ